MYSDRVFFPGIKLLIFVLILQNARARSATYTPLRSSSARGFLEASDDDEINGKQGLLIRYELKE